MDIYKKIPNFTFKPPKDRYNELLIDAPSTYNPEEIVKVICKRTYTDIQLNRRVQKNEEIEITKERAEQLINNPKGALIEYV